MNLPILLSGAGAVQFPLAGGSIGVFDRVMQSLNFKVVECGGKFWGTNTIRESKRKEI